MVIGVNVVGILSKILPKKSFELIGDSFYIVRTLQGLKHATRDYDQRGIYKTKGYIYKLPAVVCLTTVDEGGERYIRISQVDLKTMQEAVKDS